MKHYCNECELTSPMFESWGPCRQCKPGNLSSIFDLAEHMGDIEIVRLIKIMKTGTLYEAKRQVPRRRGGLRDERLLVKVAHTDSSEAIKNEAVLIAKMMKSEHRQMIPTMLPAYQHAEGAQRPYGKTVYQGETKYFIVYKYQEGDFLREMLMKNPQPWYQHAGWIAISMANVIAFLHAHTQHLLLNLSPDSIYIRMDKDGIPRPTLMDFSLAENPETMDLTRVRRYCLPAYIAPELLDSAGPFGAQTDVYGLGMLLYEMLAGRPGYAYKQRMPEDIRNSVRTSSPPPVGRTDLSEEISNIVTKAIDKAPARRFPDVRSLAKELRNRFGEVPAERRRRVPRVIIAIGLIVLLTAAVWLVLVAITGAAG